MDIIVNLENVNVMDERNRRIVFEKVMDRITVAKVSGARIAPPYRVLLYVRTGGTSAITACLLIPTSFFS